MTLHKLTAGDGYEYLIRQVVALDDTRRGRASLADYYSSKGETPGRWMGGGLASLGQPVGRDPGDPLVAEYWAVAEGSEVSEPQMKALFGEGLHPNAEKIAEILLDRGVAVAAAASRLGRPFRVDAGENAFIRRLREAYGAYNISVGANRSVKIADEIRAEIRSALGREMFAEEHGRAPFDARELSGFVARHSASKTKAVAGYDLTFTPVKSVSVVWALAPRALARRIEQAHQRAVEVAIDFLEEHAAFTRMGSGAVAQVDTTGLIIAAFDHRDSRAGDPNLHTHITVSNKVCAIGPDGIARWLALDGMPLHQSTVAASEVYNTALEGLLTELGFRFVGTDRGPGKRCVREIDGVSAEVNRWFSARRSAIETRVGELAKAFQNQHGREPTVTEFIALSQQATLETRAAKHEPRALGEQRQTWRTQAAELLGGVREVDAMIAAASSHAAIRPPAIDQRTVDRLAAAVIERVSASRSVWQIHHIRAEAERQIRYADRAGDRDAVQRIVAAAVGEHSVAVARQVDADIGEPDVLRRRDGSSVYSRHGETVYSSAAVLAAERRVLAAAELAGGRAAEDSDIGLALLEADAKGRPLNDGQRALVREMAASGARVQLAVAPAGTGKTTATAALAAAWRNSGGTVVGLAPTAAAAEVLASELGSATDTIAKLVQLSRPDPHHPGCADDPARVWFDAIDATTLVVIDEAGKASTAELDAVIQHALACGASVRLIGDDHQLTSVSAGGVLRDLAAHRNTLTLSEVVRFGDSERGRAEGAASLALRAGDPAGIAFYLDHRRIHVGADAMAADMAYEAWRADLIAGRDSVLLAPTNALVAALNDRARADRIASAGQRIGSTVTLGDGLEASVGDWIATRSNARWLRSGDRTWVKNGHRWIIRTVEADGSLTVSPLRGNTEAVVRLPARYVCAHTGLGYAATIDTRQGVTADTSHVVGNDQLSRQHLYVALTRGRDENHLYFSTAEADPHRILTPKATHPPTAVDILTALLRRDGAQQSAHSAKRRAADPFIRLGRASDMYFDALGAAAEHTVGAQTMHQIDTAAAQLDEGLAECGAWPVLRRHLALLALDGEDPVAALHRAAAASDLSDARDAAAVLDWRLPITTAAGAGPLQWLDPVPDPLAADPTWGPYLSARAGLVGELAAQVRDAADQWTAETVPAWGRPMLSHPPLVAAIAVFRASHGVDPADTRTTGPQQYANRSARVQKAVLESLKEALPLADPGTRRWRRIAETLDRRITTDPFWPQLTARLDDIAKSGADINGLLRRAMTRGGPLPDELPAAALWWRLAGNLAPVTSSAARDRSERTGRDVPALDVDVTDLRERRDAARAAVTVLETAIFTGSGGPAERAGAAELAELHRRHAEQRPHLHRLAHAHADWVDAERTYEQHQILLDGLAHQITSAVARGDDTLAGIYRDHQSTLMSHSANIAGHRDYCCTERAAAYSALIAKSGGEGGIVTERDLHQLRQCAMKSDLASLHRARLHARELDNQLHRAEAAAARAFARSATAKRSVKEASTIKAAAENYTVDQDLQQLREELAVLEIAGSRSPATRYNPAGSQSLDQSVSAIVASVADSDMSVQPVRINSVDHKHAILKGVALAAHSSGRQVLALPATSAAIELASAYRYSHRTESAAEGMGKLQLKQCRLEPGALVIVDDADHLTAEQLTWLISNAGTTNTQLLLAVSQDAVCGPSRYLVDALADNLPWSAGRDNATGGSLSAMNRVAAHLNDRRHLSTAERTAAGLLAYRDERVDSYRELAAPLKFRGHARASAERDTGLSL